MQNLAYDLTLTVHKADRGGRRDDIVDADHVACSAADRLCGDDDRCAC